jgi:AcrR family transcriptional regulator
MRATTPPPGWDAIEGLIKNGDALTTGRRKLAKAALHCFAKKGYSNTSVNDIADAAGVSIGSVYKYVRAKEDVLSLISEDGFERTNEAVAAALATAGDARVKLRAVVDGTIREGDEARDLARLLYIEFQHMPKRSQERVREQEENQVRQITGLIEDGVAAGVFDCDSPRSTAITISMFTSTWVLKRHLFPTATLDEFIGWQQDAALRLVGCQPER